MKVVQNLEIHLVHSCNLTCESCSHYSNQGLKGIVSLEEADQWMKPWTQRLSPIVFSLLGGEPTIHPQLPAFVRLARRHWPHAHLRLVTNGFFLHRHPELPAALAECNVGLYLSIHHASAEYRHYLDPIMRLLEDWVARFAIRAECYPSAAGWTRRYRGFGAAMQPYEDGQPRRSWEECPARYCRQLFEGCLWKCAPLAYLKLQDSKYKLSEKWTPYLAYRPLPPDCSDDELDAFYEREDEPYCGMCPAEPERFALPLPLASGAAR